MNNVFYRILVMFQKGERITRNRLLRIGGVTPELLDACIKQGLLSEVEPMDTGDVRYTITEKGITVRDR